MSKSGYGNKLFVVYAFLTVVAALAILMLSVMPPLSLTPSIPANSGVNLHLLAYGALCVLLCMWLNFAGKTRTPAVHAAFLTSLYGVLIECVQFGVSYRSFEMSDILINCFAAAIMIIPCHVIIRYIPLYKKTKVQAATSRLN